MTPFSFAFRAALVSMPGTRHGPAVMPHGTPGMVSSVLEYTDNPLTFVMAAQVITGTCAAGQHKTDQTHYSNKQYPFHFRSP